METVGHYIYQRIGEAVVVSQLFESIFVITANLALKQSDVQSKEEVVQVSMSKATRQAVKSIVNELKPKGDFPFEERVNIWVEARNKLAHRLVREFSWPATTEKVEDVKAFCDFVKDEGIRLTGEFMALLTEWAEHKPKLPDFKKQFSEYAGVLAEFKSVTHR